MKNDLAKIALGLFGMINLLQGVYHDWRDEYAIGDHYTLGALMCFFLASKAWSSDD